MALYSMKSGRGDLMGPDNLTLVNFGAMYPPLVHEGQWWRLITAGFLHGGVVHILMNSWVLFDLGAQTEEFYGTGRMIVIYAVSTITGFWASYHWAPLSVGASAGLFGLIGAMIAFGVRERSSQAAAMRSFYIRWAMFGLVMSFLPHIDMAAHLGGLAGGFAVAYIAGTPRLVGPQEKLWRAVAGLAIAVTVLAFVKMALWLMRGGIQG